MEMTARNPHSGLCPLLEYLSREGTKQGEEYVLAEPCVLRWEQPKERLVFWDGLTRNPAEELRQVATGLALAESHAEPAAKTVLEGNGQFLFSTPLLAVQGRFTSEGRFDLTAIMSTENPFVGAFGQIGLQMAMLQEMMAKAVKKPVGCLTMQHMGIRAPMAAVAAILESSRSKVGYDPYAEKDIKPRDFDGPLELKMLSEEGTNAIGYKSKWVRKVALPLLQIEALANENGPLAAMQKVGDIKASDWRAAMEEWLEFRLQHPEPEKDA